MKKLDNNWKLLEDIVLNVNNINLECTKTSELITLMCSFDNIAKGRCKLKIENEKKKIKFLFSLIKHLWRQIYLLIKKNFPNYYIILILIEGNKLNSSYQKDY